MDGDEGEEATRREEEGEGGKKQAAMRDDLCDLWTEVG